MRHTLSVFVAAAVLSIVIEAGPVSAEATVSGSVDALFEAPDWRDRRVAFSAEEHPLGDLIRDVAGALGVSVEVGDGVSGVVTRREDDIAFGVLVESLATDFDLDLWANDGVLHVSAASARRTLMLIEPPGGRAWVVAVIAAAGLDHDEWIAGLVGDDAMLELTAPPAFADAVEGALRAAADPEPQQTDAALDAPIDTVADGDDPDDDAGSRGRGVIRVIRGGRVEYAPVRD